ncbi:MAG: GntR family transcriptional regulator [Actinobacteria bacterium]|nr:GntR family transcriptional regulator [Actinomycetota bacterium]
MGDVTNRLALPPGTLVLRIDLSRPVPPYEQLRAQIAGLIAAGELPSGSRLASVRQLAGDLGVAPGTVARAYSELEAAGHSQLERSVGKR